MVTRGTSSAPGVWEPLSGERILHTGEANSNARIRDRALGTIARARPRPITTPPRPPPPAHVIVENDIINAARTVAAVRNVLLPTRLFAGPPTRDEELCDTHGAPGCAACGDVLENSLTSAAETARALGSAARDAAAALRAARERVTRRGDVRARRSERRGFERAMIRKDRYQRLTGARDTAMQRMAAVMGSVGAASVVAVALAAFGDMRTGPF